MSEEENVSRSEDQAAENPVGRRRVPPILTIADAWPQGEVWFQEFLPTQTPWGSEQLLDPVPEEMRGLWAIRLGAPAFIGERHRKSGDLVPVENGDSISRLIDEGKKITAMAVPWYDRLIPAGLTVPHLQSIDRRSYLKDLAKPFLRALLVCIATVAAVFVAASRSPEIVIYVVIAGIMFGVFPLLQVGGLAMVPVHRVSVEELNRRRVNNILFFRRFQLLSYWPLKVSLAALGAVYLGQLAVSGFQSDISPSVMPAALVRTSVIEQGEWWRLLTSGLLHAFFLHFALNAMALYNLGRLICAVANPSVLALVFLVSVITGALASLYFGAAPISLGASGGALGCLGYLLVIFYRFRGTVPGMLRHNLVQATIVVAALGYIGRGLIDNAAHAGGFLGGVLIALLSWRSFRVGAPAMAAGRALGMISTGILIAGVIKVAVEFLAVRS
jgi:rhomboid protease GluP